MSDDKPTINVTRGRRDKRNGDKRNGDKRNGTRSGHRRRRPEGDPAGGAAGGASLVPSLSDVTAAVTQGVQTVWWAGLGTLSMAEEAGTQVFNALVEEGRSWEAARRERTREAARRVQQMGRGGVDAAEALEERVRQEVDEVLRRVGVPSRDDLDDLRGQVDDLSQRIDRLATILEQQSKGDETDGD
jgi:poly(hydroxyalkanoate) granule-associated protein